MSLIFFFSEGRWGGGGGKGVFSLKFIIGRVGREVESAKQCKRLLIDLLKEFLISL